MHDYVGVFQRVEDLGRRAATSEIDDFLRAQLAQHICVVVSGTIEQTCSSILADYATKTANERTARYAKGRLAQFHNAGPKKIEELLATFDPAWSKELQQFWTGRIRDSISSLINNRHNIAHGLPVSVSLAQSLEYARAARSFCQKLNEMIVT